MVEPALCSGRTMKAIDATMTAARRTNKTGMHNHHLLPCREAIHPSAAANTANIDPYGLTVRGNAMNTPKQRMAAMPSFVERSIPVILSPC